MNLLLVLLAGCAPTTEGPEDGDGDSFTEATGDCDDTDPSRFPGAPEVCNGVDDDCDGAVDDDAETLTWYADADGDGYGDPAVTAEACSAPEGFVDNTEDCDDGEAFRNPDAIELCDGYAADDDCDGLVDEAGCRPFGNRTLDQMDGFVAWDDPATGTLTTSAAVGDVNGDGQDDLIVAQPDRGDGVVAFAFPSTVDGSSPGGPGITTSGVREVDSAGVAVAWIPGAGLRGEDWLALGAPDTPFVDAGVVLVVEGPWTGDRSPALAIDTEVLVGPSGGVRFGAALAGAGLFDADDTPDLVVGDPEAQADEVALAMFPGGRDLAGLSGPDCVWSAGDDATLAGAAVAAAGDVDGDGRDDVVVGAPEGRASTLDPRSGWVVVVRGGDCAAAANLRDAGPVFLGDEDGLRLGATVGGGGDVDGDGYDDVVAGAPGRATDAAGGALIFPGGADEGGERSARESALAFVQGDLRGGHTGSAVAIVGDVDGDRFDDVAIANGAADVDYGWTLVGLWYGGATLPAHDYATAPDVSLWGGCAEGGPFGVPVVGLDRGGGPAVAFVSGCTADGVYPTDRGVYLFEPGG